MNTSRSIINLVQQISRQMLIDESSAISLFNSAINGSTIQVELNEIPYSCRICRWNQIGLRLQKCPCQCKGTVGYVHLKCLRRWILHRGNSRCEVCGTMFDLTAEKRNYKQMLQSFFQAKYFGAVIKNCIHLTILGPISYLILYQVLLIMDNLQLEEHNTLQIVFLAPALLLSSSLCSIVFFHILEFGLTRILRIKNIVKHWWTFGGQETDPGLDMNVPSDVFEFF